MRARLIAIGLGLASLVALVVGAIVPACYSPPQPVCGFVCSNTGACPADYTCAPTLDNRCHLNGMPITSCDMVDAGVGLEVINPEFVEFPDAPMIDAPVIDVPIIDGMVDGMVDGMSDGAVDAAPMVDAMIDAAPMVDAMDDAAPMVDAMGDSAPDDAVAADAATD